MKDNKLVTMGYRNEKDGLWDVPIPQQPQKTCATERQHDANVIILTFNKKLSF